MKQILEYVLRPDDTWPPYLAGPVTVCNGVIYYAYRSVEDICCVKIAPDGVAEELSFRVPEGKQAVLPDGWRLQEWEGNVVLSCGDRIFLDLNAGMREIAALVEDHPQLDETVDVHLSDCILRWKNNRSIQCFGLDGSLLWEEKHRGYRYTPFEACNGCILFGTAGHGGGLYCYRKADGKCLCSVDTKGTTSYVWHSDAIVTRGRAGQLWLIDPFRGTIVKSLELTGKFNDYSRFFSNGKLLCAVGFEQKTNAPHIYLLESE